MSKNDFYKYSVKIAGSTIFRQILMNKTISKIIKP